MSQFWCAARLMPQREAYATDCLGVEGFEVYLPRLREQRVIRGRRVEVRPPLFPGYIFIAIVLQWHAARWAPGVANIIMDGMTPAKVPDRVIDEIRSRERGGLVELPKPRGLRTGDRIRITSGPFQDHLGLYAGQAPRDRVAVLLRLLGGRTGTSCPPLPWRRCHDRLPEEECASFSRYGQSSRSSARCSSSGWPTSWTPVPVLRARPGRHRSGHPRGAGGAVDPAFF